MRDILELYLSLYIAFQAPADINKQLDAFKVTSDYVVVALQNSEEISPELKADRQIEYAEVETALNQVIEEELKKEQAEILAQKEQKSVEMIKGEKEQKEDAQLPVQEKQKKDEENKEGEQAEDAAAAEINYKPFADLEYSDLNIEPKKIIVAESNPKQIDKEEIKEVVSTKPDDLNEGEGEKPITAQHEEKDKADVAELQVDKEAGENSLEIEETDSEVAISFPKDPTDVEAVDDEINSETDLFSLDKGEFKIEDITEENAAAKQQKQEKEKKYEIISDIKSKLIGKQKGEINKEDFALISRSGSKKSADNKGTGQDSEKVEKTKVIELTEDERKQVELAAKMRRFAKKMKLVEKPYDSYEKQVVVGRLHSKQYNDRNRHLDAITYKEEFYQMLFAAIKSGDLPTINAVTKKIGIVQNVTVAKQTPLVYAITNNQFESMLLLLRLGYDPNVRDVVQNMPLHIAVRENRLDFVTELLKFGANPTVPGADLKLPVTLALERDNITIAKILQKAGAQYGKLANNFDENIARGNNANKATAN